MSTETLGLEPSLQKYLRTVSVREDTVLRALREHTASLPDSNMQISPEQGQFLHFLLHLIGARRVIEIGTYTGYSALWMAQSVGPDGRVVCCDISQEWTDIAKKFWAQAGVAGRIELRLAPALDTLSALQAEGDGEFDFAFIDADKENMQAYFEHLLPLLRPGGLIAVDNTLWSGRVADPTEQDPATVAIRTFNKHLLGDARVEISLVPISDGLTLACKA